MAFTYDGINKIISLDSSTTVSLVDLYSRWVDWTVIGDNIKYPQAFTVVSQPPIVPLYATLVNNWKIRPYAGDYTVTISQGYLYTSDNSDPFVPVLSGIEPRIIYREPVAAIGYATGSGVLPADIAAIAAAVKAVMETPGTKLSKTEVRTRLIPAPL